MQWTSRGPGNGGGKEISVESFEELVEKELGVGSGDPPAEDSHTSAAFDGIMETLRKVNG